MAAENLAAAKALAAELEKASVTVGIKVGEGGRAFGSVSSKKKFRMQSKRSFIMILIKRKLY